MFHHDARQRIMDPDVAVGPEQFDATRADFVADSPTWGRDDPQPANWHMAQLRQAENGDAFYNDLEPVGDGWADADGGAGYGALWQNVRAC